MPPQVNCLYDAVKARSIVPEGMEGVKRGELQILLRVTGSMGYAPLSFDAAYALYNLAWLRVSLGFHLGIYLLPVYRHLEVVAGSA